MPVGVAVIAPPVTTLFFKTMLAQIPGVSYNIAECISSNYQSVFALINEYQNKINFDLNNFQPAIFDKR